MNIKPELLIIKINDDFLFEPYLFMFNQATIAKINSYKFRHDQVRTFTSELLKQYYLAKYLNTNISNLRINYNQYGKPYLVNLHPKIDFNISHSGDYVVITIAHNARIGIDIERINHDIVPAELSAIVFSDSEQTIVANDVERFFRLWTKKESLIKMHGTGFASDFYQTTSLNNDDFQDLDNKVIYCNKLDTDYFLSLCLGMQIATTS